jgi:oligopeptide transport system ATP-binding protein
VHQLYARPAHPYTRALLESVPRLRREGELLKAIAGLPPNLTRIPPGCPFHPRCVMEVPVCREVLPPVLDLGNGRLSACHRARELVDA